MAGGARRRILRRDDHDEKAPIGETVGMKRVIADRGYDANRIRATLREQGTIPVIPGHRNRKRPIQYDERRYKNSWRVEAIFCRLKDFRRIPTRYYTPTKNFMSAGLPPATWPLLLRTAP